MTRPTSWASKALALESTLPVDCLEHDRRREGKPLAQLRLEVAAPRLVVGNRDADDPAFAGEGEEPRHLGLGNLHEFRHLVLAEPIHVVEPCRKAETVVRIG